MRKHVVLLLFWPRNIIIFFNVSSTCYLVITSKYILSMYSVHGFKPIETYGVKCMT